MTRYVIMTVGMTHSGKSAFAKQLEKTIEHAVVIDQDNHALFINEYYQNIVPLLGPNTLKSAITTTIVNYAIEQTSTNLIVANANLDKNIRLRLLEGYKQKGFKTIIVHFDYTLQTLQDRLQQSTRSTSIFRSASSFDEVLLRQYNNVMQELYGYPSDDEADYYFKVNEEVSVEDIISKIVTMVNQAPR